MVDENKNGETEHDEVSNHGKAGNAYPTKFGKLERFIKKLTPALKTIKATYGKGYDRGKIFVCGAGSLIYGAFRWLNDHNGAVVVLLSAVLVWNELRQWEILKEQGAATAAQLDIMRDEQRPWMGPNFGKIEWGEDFTEPFMVEIKYMNFGNSPAFYCTQRTAVTHFPVNQAMTIDELDQLLTEKSTRDPAGATVFPGTTLDSLMLDLTFSKETSNQIMSEKSNLCIFGMIEYRDASGIGHITRHFARLNISKNRFEAFGPYNTAE